MKNYTSEMYCTQCGRKGIPVIRDKSKNREEGHLKKLYCVFCGCETNHVEVRPFSEYTWQDFNCEFSNHNFDESGQRKETWRACVQKAKESGCY